MDFILVNSPDLIRRVENAVGGSSLKAHKFVQDAVVEKLEYVEGLDKLYQDEHAETEEGGAEEVHSP